MRTRSSLLPGLALAAWCGLAAAPAAGGERPPSGAGFRPADIAGTESSPGPKPGWLKVGRSLLYYDREGQLSNEIGLGRWEEADSGRLQSKTIEGGATANHRFAWILDKRTTWNSLKTKVLESRRALRFFDSSGHELWSEDGPDLPPDSPPLVSSQDGEVFLIALRRKDGWIAAVKTYLGNTLWEAGPFPRLETIQISPNGRYGLARWNEPDKAAVHSFLDIEAKQRQDVASDRFFLGKAVIDDEGRAFSGKALVFSFSPPAASTGTTPSVTTVPAPSAPAPKAPVPPAQEATP